MPSNKRDFNNSNSSNKNLLELKCLNRGSKLSVIDLDVLNNNF